MADASIDHRALFQRSAAMLVVLEPDGRLREASAGFCRVLGYPADEIEALTLAGLAHPLDEGAVIAAVERARGGGEEEALEHRFRGKDESYRRLSWSLAPAPGGGLLAGAFHDITRHHTELGLFKALADATSDYVALATPDGRRFYVNPAGRAMLGWDDEDVRSVSVSDSLSAPFLEIFLKEARPAMMSRGVWSGDMEYMHKDRTPIPIALVGMLLRNDDGKPVAIASIAHDMRRYKELEARLRASIRELSSPILEVWEGVLALPIVGVVDSGRAAQMTEALLGAIVERSGRVAVIDLTGVDTIDTATLDHLFRMAKAASLLGSLCVISGLSSRLAHVIAELGIELGDLRTFRSLREALRFALRAARGGAGAQARPPA